MALKFKTPLDAVKYEAKKAAKDLCYGKEVIQDIEWAESESEVNRIMINARNRRYK